MNKKIKLFSLISAPILLGGGFAPLVLVNQCGTKNNIDISSIGFLSNLGNLKLFSINETRVQNIANAFLNVNKFVIEEKCSNFTINDFKVVNIDVHPSLVSTAEIHGIGKYVGKFNVAFRDSSSDEVQNNGYFLYGDVEASDFDPANPVRIESDTLRDVTAARELVIEPGRLTYYDETTDTEIYLPEENYEFDFGSSDDTIAQIVRIDDGLSDNGTYQIVTCENTGMVNLYVNIIGLNNDRERTILWQGISCVFVATANRANFTYSHNYGELHKKPDPFVLNQYRDFQLVRNGLNVITGVDFLSNQPDCDTFSSDHFVIEQQGRMVSRGLWTSSTPIDEPVQTEYPQIRYRRNARADVSYKYGLNNSKLLTTRIEPKWYDTYMLPMYFRIDITFSYKIALFFKNAQKNYTDQRYTSTQQIITGYSNTNVELDNTVVFSATYEGGQELPSQLKLNPGSGIIEIDPNTISSYNKIVLKASKNGFVDAVSEPFNITVTKPLPPI